MKRRLTAMLVYILATFPVAYLWHLVLFHDYYQQLEVFRDDVAISSGLASILIQSWVWAVMYERMFAGQSIFRGACGFASLALPLAWSFMVAAVSAKHPMNSMVGFVAIETSFIVLQYLIVSPLIAWTYASAAPVTKGRMESAK